MLIAISKTIMIRRLFVVDKEIISIGSESDEMNVPMRKRLISAAVLLMTIPSIRNGHFIVLSGAPTSCMISISWWRLWIERYIELRMMRKLAMMKTSSVVRMRSSAYEPIEMTWSIKDWFSEVLSIVSMRSSY